jgi:hypothetical protein
MYSIKNIILASFILFLFTNCDEFKDDKMTLHKHPYYGSELRMDGYYYIYDNNTYITPWCFYQDGCLLVISGRRSDLQEADNHIIQMYIRNFHYKQVQHHWGVFHINNNNIVMQYYQGDNYRTIVKVEEGHILNDTTFQMTLRYRVNGEDRESINDVYHFRQFSPKPDSTNKWIK